MFSLTDFNKQLQETISWCLPRILSDDLKSSLRTVLPASVEYIDDPDLLMKLANCAITIRMVLLEERHRIDKHWGKTIESLPSGLAGGRLLIFYPEWAVGDPGANVMTSDYFNEITIPACDTWVYGGIDTKFRDGVTKDVHYIICWVPAQLLSMVEEAIQTDPTECFAG